MNLLRTAISLVIAIGVVCGAPAANAVLVFSVDVGGTIFSCQDNASCDSSPTAGIIDAVPNTTSGVEFNPFVVSVANNTILLSADLINLNALPITVKITLGATGFVGPVNQFSTNLSGNSSTLSTVTAEFYDDPTNSQGATTTTSHPGDLINTLSTSSLDFLETASGSLSTPDTGMFSMTEQVTINLAPITVLSLTAGEGKTNVITESIPEPGSTILLGLSVIALGLIKRRLGGTSAVCAQD